MSHFYERVLNDTIDYYKEINKLIRLFKKETIHTDVYYESVSIAKYINEEFFRKLDLSTNYVSLFDLLAEIENEELTICFTEYSELVLSISAQLINKEYYSPSDKDSVEEQLSSIIKIIKFDLEKLNLEYRFITSDAGRVAIILPKDAFVESVLEDVEDQNISRGIVEYKSIRMEGNVDGKEKLLYSFGKYIEPLLKNDELKENNKRLFDDVTFMPNNFDLRHNNKDINEQKYYHATLKDREEWLDKLFVEILLVIKSEQESVIHKELSSLRKK